MIIFLGKKTSHHHRHWSLPRLFIQGWVIQTFHLISALLVGETQGIPRVCLGPGMSWGTSHGHDSSTVPPKRKPSGHTGKREGNRKQKTFPKAQSFFLFKNISGAFQTPPKPSRTLPNLWCLEAPNAGSSLQIPLTRSHPGQNFQEPRSNLHNPFQCLELLISPLLPEIQPHRKLVCLSMTQAINTSAICILPQHNRGCTAQQWW